MGKQSLGDMDISDDGTVLFVTNLFQQSVVAINAQTKALIGSYPITASALGLSCPQTDIRPWGLKYYKGKLYVGMVCSAESSQASADLKGYVLEFNPSNPGGGFSVFYSLNLNYIREMNSPGPWKPWHQNAFDPGSSSSDDSYNPQPILSDIEFDVDGSLILGFLDRHTMMFSSSNLPPDPAASSSASTVPFPAGDILRVCKTSTGFALEGTAGCAYNFPYSNGGEFYNDRRHGGNGNGNIKETAGGSLALLAGYGQIVSTTMDEYNVNENGIAWWNNTTGIRDKAYMVYDGNVEITQGKASGLGDVELLIDAAPIEIGNRVFMDTDSDGEQDADEMGLDGIKVELWKAGSKVTETTTANGGQWYFTNVDAKTDYEVKILASSFPSGKSITTSNASGNAKDLIDSDAALVGADAVITYKTGSAGQNNHSLDFGFKTAQICNLTASATGTNVSCNAGTNGTATATPTGNTGAVTYLWSNTATTANLTGLSAGTYTVTVTESANCTATASYNVTEPSDITLNCTKTDVTTTGGNDGTATVAASGGTAPYTYLWSNAATTDAITGLTAGTYTVTVTDANGCSDVCNSQVNEPSCNLTASVTGTNVSCNAGTNGTATATPTGNTVAVTYLWSNTATTVSLTGLSAGTYTVTVTESANCTATANYTVTEPSDITLACAKTDVTTAGGNDGAATVTATGGTSPYTYLWSNAATTASITGLTAGTFTVTVTDANGCSDVCSSQVNEPGCVKPNAGTDQSPACVGNTAITTATLAATAVNGGTWTQVGTVPNTAMITTPTSENSMITGLIPGVYRFIWATSATCSDTVKITIPSCQAVQPCSPDIFAYWNFEDCSPASNTPTNGMDPFATNLSGCSGLTVSKLARNHSGNSCQTRSNGSISICMGSSTDLTFVDNADKAIMFSLTYPAGSIGKLTSISFESMAPKFVDFNNSGDTTNRNNYPTLWGIRVLKDNLEIFKLIDQPITLNTFTLNNLDWTNNPNFVINGANTFKFEILGYLPSNVPGAGIREIWDVDELKVFGYCGNCACTQPSAINFAKVAPTCTGSADNNDGKITFTSISDADKYFINSGTTSTGTYTTASNIPMGGTNIQTNIPNVGATYTVRFYNGGENCYKDTTIIIQPINCTIACNLTSNATSTNIKCNGSVDGTATVIPSGNLSAVTYLWSNGITTASISGLSAGTYTVTTTESISCTATSSVTIAEPAVLALTCSKVDVTTTGGTNGEASVIATGGTSPYTYAWSNGATTATINNITSGIYSVTVSDFNNCSAGCTSKVTEPGCTTPTLGTNTATEGTCSNAIPNDDATITFSGVSDATLADRVIGSFYGISPAYGDATNANASTGNLQFTGLKHNTTYTFRFWNGASNCFTDITITTPSKICSLPCPTKVCTPVKVTKL